MIKFAYKGIRKQKLFIGSIIIVALLFTTVPISITSLTYAKLSTAETIGKYGRGSYDILVRPPAALSNIEKSHGVVEENFLTGGDGGISIDQYKEIQNLSDVEVAAPVAVVGFFANDTGGVEYTIPNSSETSITSFRFFYQTGLGPEYSQMPETHVVSFPDINYPIIPNRPLDVSIEPNGKKVSLALPDRYDLLIAVDPVQEDRLIHYDGKIRSQLPEQLIYKSSTSAHLKTPDGKALPVIPLLINEDVRVPLGMEVQERKTTTSEETLMQKTKAIQNLSELDGIIARDLSSPPIWSYEYKLDTYLKPFESRGLQLDRDGLVTNVSRMTSSHANTSVYYLTNRLNYEPSQDGNADFDLIPYTDGEKAAYRNLKKVGLNDTDKVKYSLFEFDIKGYFDGDDIVTGRNDPSPLGIYSFSDVTQVSDRNGHPTGIKLQKDMIPDTFLPIQAAALTNLDAARTLKGIAPIDAIRVRVAGVTDYDQNAERKILRVAESIQRLTGLQTDIVAGASKQNIHVKIPAVGYHPAVGIVQEVWTSLGVSTKIVSATNELSLLILGAVAFLALLYSIVHTKTLLIVRERELSILRAVGWKIRDIRNLLLLEWTIKLVIATAISYLPLLMMSSHTDVFSYWYATFLTQIFIWSIVFISVSLTVGSLKKRSVQNNRSKRNKINPHSISLLAFGNFLAQIRYNGWSMLLIAISGGVALFICNTILAMRNQIGMTFLGDAVNVATSYGQWSIVGASMILVVIGLIENNAVLIANRRDEYSILRLIGWKASQAIQVIVEESSINFGVGLVGAFLLGLGTFRLFFTSFPAPLLMQSGLLLLFGAIMALFTTLQLKRLERLI